MYPGKWLEVAFGANSRVRILRKLASDPGKGWTERELAQSIGMSANTVNASVHELDSAGILFVRKIGAAHEVRLNPSVAPRLRQLFSIEERALAEVLSAVRSALPPGVACYAFGSTVEGTARSDSDLDLLVIAKDPETAKEVAYAIEVKVHEKFPATTQVIAIGIIEARRRANSGVVRNAIETGELLSRSGLEAVI
ncbi:MAG: nucleotidyltransferase domain-containing protein [Thermoplasmatota archaeon]